MESLFRKNPIVDTNSFLISVSKGEIPGHRLFVINGFNEDVDTASIEDIWPILTPLAYQTSAVSLEAVSTNAADGVGGTGIREMIFNGLDGGFDELGETIIMNGTTPVALSSQYLRPLNGEATVVGSVGKAVGDVIIRVAGGGATQAIIKTANSSTNMTHFTIPAGHDGYGIRLLASSNKDAARMRISSRALGGPFVERVYIPINAGTTPIDLKSTRRIGEKTDIKGEVLAGSNNTEVSLNYTLLVIKKGF